MENLFCINCPFTCKGANECKPRQLLNEMRKYLPSVIDIDGNSCAEIHTMTKPNISCTININGNNFYF